MPHVSFFAHRHAVVWCQVHIVPATAYKKGEKKWVVEQQHFLMQTDYMCF